jgi:hypothetical protein
LLTLYFSLRLSAAYDDGAATWLSRSGAYIMAHNIMCLWSEFCMFPQNQNISWSV